MSDELTCPSCNTPTMKQIAGSEYDSLVARNQLWECSKCEYREER